MKCEFSKVYSLDKDNNNNNKNNNNNNNTISDHCNKYEMW
jgi:hypothetical protein